MEPLNNFQLVQSFVSKTIKSFLLGLYITLRELPLRSSHNNGIVERNNGSFKAVLDHLSLEITSASLAAIVSKASFLANRFKGSSILSSFQLPSGYSPSVAGTPVSVVPQQLLDAYI